MTHSRKRVVVSIEAVKAGVRRNLKASARLEGREVPDGYVRSAAVEKYLAERVARPTIAGSSNGEWMGAGSDADARHLLDVLADEVWPLLADGSPIGKAEQERILGDPTAEA